MCNITDEILICLSDDAENIEQIKNLLRLNDINIPCDHDLICALFDLLNRNKIRIIYPDKIDDLNMDNIYDCWFALN